jgi:hypothetical protein
VDVAEQRSELGGARAHALRLENRVGEGHEVADLLRRQAAGALVLDQGGDGENVATEPPEIGVVVDERVQPLESGMQPAMSDLGICCLVELGLGSSFLGGDLLLAPTNSGA